MAASSKKSAKKSSAKQTRSPVAAVTGGNGFIGRFLVSRLREAGYQVRILTSSGRHNSGAGDVDDPHISYVAGNLVRSTAEQLAGFLEGADALYHLAGAVTREPGANHKLMELHVQGTRHLLNAALLAKTERVILMSTSGTVGVSDKPDLADEDSPYAINPALRWPYYESKIYQEKLALAWSREHGRSLAVLRPSLALGPGDVDMSSTGDVLKFLERKIPGIPPGGLSFVDARDVADATLAAGQLDLAQIKTGDAPYRTYLLGSANMSFRVYLNLLSKLSGISGPVMEVPPKLSVAGARAWARVGGETGRRLMDLDPASADMANYYWYIDCSRAERELGFAPRSAETTLRETIDWLRQRHR